jgi:hypothetical protein
MLNHSSSEFWKLVVGPSSDFQSFNPNISFSEVIPFLFNDIEQFQFSKWNLIDKELFRGWIN